MFQHTAARRRLANTVLEVSGVNRFNTQPPEGGWGNLIWYGDFVTIVSTHSRPKAAGYA